MQKYQQKETFLAMITYVNALGKEKIAPLRTLHELM